MSRAAALRVLQLGAIAAVLAATATRTFDLDRFLVPKELVLHVTALLAGALTLRTRATRLDYALFGFLLLSAVSTVLATNPWLGVRALTVSASSYLIFRAAREVPRGPLLNALALAVVVAATTALLQAYGVWLDIFTENRAPGGTLGNRNFIGHAAAFGLPLVLLAALRGSRLAPLGAGIVTAALVLTRSRAAWLAAAIVLIVFLISVAWAGRMRRLGLVMLFAIAGAAAALLIPNTLRWRSDNPYLDSVKGVASYEEGSGRGRLVQYQRSLAMAAAHPVFGVGPGNWAVEYPEFAGRHDPSMDDNDAGMTTNPWPSSDWIAYLSERGFVATLLLGLAMLGIALQRDRLDPLNHVARFATVAGATATGALDAVLLLGAPSLIVWAALGALMPEETPAVASDAAPEGESVPVPPPPLARRQPAVAILLVVAAIGVFRSGAQLAAIEVSQSSVTHASRIDPANYRLHMRLARGGKRKARCAHARAAHALYPHAAEARRLAAGCE